MGNDKPKLKLAVYWGAACGGCCVSVLDVHEKLFDVVANADLVFWPIALDFKYADVEAMPDQHIDITLFNGAVRNSENEHIELPDWIEKEVTDDLRYYNSYLSINPFLNW